MAGVGIARNMFYKFSRCFKDNTYLGKSQERTPSAYSRVAFSGCSFKKCGGAWRAASGGGNRATWWPPRGPFRALVQIQVHRSLRNRSVGPILHTLLSLRHDRVLITVPSPGGTLETHSISHALAILVRGPRARPVNTFTRSMQTVNAYYSIIFSPDSTKWYTNHHNMDMEPYNTVKVEIGASISSHCRYISKQTAQELLVTLRGRSESGIRRYFGSWPQMPAAQTQGAVVWETRLPEKLYELMGENNWHKYSAGCVKLQVKMGALLGHKVLMVQPPFRASFWRAASSRTTLLIEFKLIVMHETGQLKLPPDCHYPDLEVQRLKGIAIKALKGMKAASFPLSPGLPALAEEPQSSITMIAVLARQREERAKAMGTAERRAAGKKRALEAAGGGRGRLGTLVVEYVFHVFTLGPKTRPKTRIQLCSESVPKTYLVYVEHTSSITHDA
eukprot:5086086-Pleurochrysis_carterae.AAC.1